MTDFKVTDEAVEAAIDGERDWHYKYYTGDEFLDQKHAMRAAIEAALPVMFERVGYIEPEEIESLSYAVQEGFESDSIICSEPDEVFSVTLYRLKEPK